MKRGDHAAAEELYNEALASIRKAHGDENYMVTYVLQNLAYLFMKRGDNDRAEPLIRETLALRRKLMGDEHLLVASTLMRLGEILGAQGRYAEAESALRKCVAIREQALSPDSPSYWLLPNARSMLGCALTGRGATLIESDVPAAGSMFAEAEPLLIESGDWLTRNADRIPPRISRLERLRRALERIVELYEVWNTVAPDTGKAEQAAEVAN